MFYGSASMDPWDENHHEIHHQKSQIQDVVEFVPETDSNNGLKTFGLEFFGALV